jgi:hypothetical protein
MTARFIVAGLEAGTINPAVIDRRYRKPLVAIRVPAYHILRS